jgi:hypothetical protein
MQPLRMVTNPAPPCSRTDTTSAAPVVLETDSSRFHLNLPRTCAWHIAWEKGCVKDSWGHGSSSCKIEAGRVLPANDYGSSRTNRLTYCSSCPVNLVLRTSWGRGSVTSQKIDPRHQYTVPTVAPNSNCDHWLVRRH